MGAGFKWIGGLTLAVLALIGSALFVGRGLEARDVADDWLSAHDPVIQRPAAPKAASPEAAPPVTPASDALVIRRILPIEGPIRYGEWHWDDEGVPPGPLVMTVDLQARVLSVFRGGYEIGAAAVLIGSPDHPTPTGVFPILSKERHNISEKYNDAPMPWTMRLTWDGVAIHGGSTVERGYASHGCIGAPDEFVSRIFAIASVGDRVIITDGRRAALGSPLS